MAKFNLTGRITIMNEKNEQETTMEVSVLVDRDPCDMPYADLVDLAFESAVDRSPELGDDYGYMLVDAILDA